MSVIAIVEMPKGTRYKYEISKETGWLMLDRPVNEPIPHNYGFIPHTLCDDGDPIDVFIASLEPIPSLTSVQIAIYGVIDCTDDGKSDPKLLAYVKGDDFGLKQINLREFTEEVLLYLRNYKEGLRIDGVFGAEAAVETLVKSKLFYYDPK